MQGMTLMFLFMLVSLGIASLWGAVPVIKDSVHTALDPSAGALLDWQVTIGMIVITAVIMFVSTLFQKYASDQDAIKAIKDEQKIIQEEMKLAKEHPEKTMELSKKSMELTMKAMPLTMRPLMYTIIPFILLLRWLGDYFVAHPGIKFLGFMSWFWAYFVFSIILSSIFRKVLKVQ